MSERDRDKERVRRKTRRKIVGGKKSQNWHLNFYWRFAVCSPNKLTASTSSSAPLPLLPLPRQPQSIDKGGANSAKTSVEQCRAQMLMNADFVAPFWANKRRAKVLAKFTAELSCFSCRAGGRGRGLFCNRFNIKLRFICTYM